jgi:hypothetical protein
MEEVTKYGDTALDIIGQSKILTEDDLNVVRDLKGELVDNFLHSQVFRTRTEMEVSVLNDMNFPTPDSKYWQSQREQNVHFHELVMLSYEYRKNLVEIKKLKRKLEPKFLPEGPLPELDSLDKELLQIEIEKLTFISRNQERVAKDRIREIKEWHEIKARLIPGMEFGLEDCGEHQLISYTRRWIQQYLQMGNGGSPGERQNLISQLQMGIKACQSHGILAKILQELTPQVRSHISQICGIDIGKQIKG